MTMHFAPAPAVAGENKRLRWLLVAILIVVSALLMALAARGDLFIDEVVSLNKASSVQSCIEIFTKNQNDNNHPLNTLFLYALGDQRHLFVYRIPAVTFGIAFVAVLIMTSSRLGKTVPVWAACLAGLSYPLISLCSEARGYSFAMFFAVLAYEMLQRCWERYTLLKLFLFWIALVLGTLSHFSFIMVCMALGIWSLAHDRFAGDSARVMALNVAKYYGVPVVFLASLYLIYIRHMTILGGPILTWWEAISDAPLQLLGFSPVKGLRVVGVLMGLLLALCGIWKLFVQKREDWLFFAAALFVAPALMLLVFQPRFLYFRYFSVCFPFFYLLLAYLFAEWFETRGKIKFLPLLLIVGITAGHLIKVTSLLHYGRGHYRQAIQEMAAATPGPLIKISSDHDFRNSTLLEFYARFLPPSKQVDYITRPRRDRETPDWFILHCGDPTFAAYPDVEVGGIGKYDLFGTYPYGGSSGWSWFVYRRPAETTSTEVSTTATATHPSGTSHE